MAHSNESLSSRRQQGSQQHGTEGTQGRGQQSAFQASAAEQQSSRAMQTRASTSAVPSYFGGPFSMMRRISEDMDRLFESFGFGRGLLWNDFGQGALAGFGSGEGAPSLWAPHVVVYERDGKFVVNADLPGVRKEDVNVEIAQDALTIQGHCTQEKTSSAEGSTTASSAMAASIAGYLCSKASTPRPLRRASAMACCTSRWTRRSEDCAAARCRSATVARPRRPRARRRVALPRAQAGDQHGSDRRGLEADADG